MKKIFIITPFSRDANSFWRCMGPMGYLAKHSEGEIQIYCAPPSTSLSWDALSEYDLIFFHRPCRQDDLILMQVARNLNIPTWIDYDDWLFNLPDWNPNAANYHLPIVQHVMATMIACADIVTVSTQALVKEFLDLNPNTILVPNAYRSDLFPFRKKDPPPRKPIYTWRGTNTHEGDLLSVAQAFLNFTDKIHFLGSPSYSLSSQMDRERFVTTNHVDVVYYFKALYNLAPKVFLFPLKDIFFNRCKSNIAWIEAIHAGALCVAPNTPEWKHPGVISYTPDSYISFFNSADSVMKMGDAEYNKHVSEAYDYMRSKFDITLINQIRQEILNAVFSPNFTRNKRDPYDQLTGMWALSVLKKTPLPRLGDQPEKQSVS